MQLTEVTILKAKCELASQSLFDYCKIRDSEEFYNEKDAPYLEIEYMILYIKDMEVKLHIIRKAEAY